MADRYMGWQARYGGSGGPVTKQPYSDRSAFFQSQPNAGDFLNQALNNEPRVVPGQTKPSNLAAWLSGSFLPALQGGGMIGTRLGLANLNELLANQGRLPPQLMNQQLTQIGREGAGRTEALQGELASRGLQNSGVGLALGEASRAATGNQLAGRRAAEDNMAHDRQMQALQMLYQLVIGPSLDVTGMHFGNTANKRADDAARQAAMLAALGSLTGGAATAAAASRTGG